MNKMKIQLVSLGAAALLAVAGAAHAQSTPAGAQPSTSPGMSNNKGSESGPTPRMSNSGTDGGTMNNRNGTMNNNAGGTAATDSATSTNSTDMNNGGMRKNRRGYNADGTRRARADRG